jgi:uncharacterized RDD family membrane protein YckC
MQKPTQVVGRRVVAYLIDLVLWSAIIAGSWFALTSQQSGECPSNGGGYTIGGNCRGFMHGDDGKRIAWFVIIAAASIGIFLVMQGLTGKTPGKAAVGIKVIKADGQPPGILRAFVREVLWIVDGLFVNLVGLITAISSRNNQRVGDMAASTFVVDRNFAGAIAGSPAGGQPAFGGPPPSGAPVGAPPPQAQPQQTQQPAGQAANWYPDPQGQARLRYWDGERWTEHTSA